MATILSIDTSTSVCSVSLSAESMILIHREDFEGRNHASLLSAYIKDCLDFMAEHELKLDAIAVSMGPGSYTGLRIGLSEAKGLAYALDVPMIGLSTLQIMATQVMFTDQDVTEDTIFVPMIDARRMEVYTAAYDLGLSALLEPRPMILDADSYAPLIATGRPLLLFGNGSDKAKELVNAPNVRYVADVQPLATDMLALADLAYSRRQFIDLAYSTPTYLKDFQATKPKNKILGQ